MSADLTIYNLGSKGVNVDKSPIHLDDGELLQAQNATQDPLGGGGGIRKRQGLVKFNASAGAGSFLGGIGVPLADLTQSTRTVWIGAVLATTANEWKKSTDGFTTAPTIITSGAPAVPRGKHASAAATSVVYGIADFSTATTYLVGSPGSGCIVNRILYFAADSYVTYNATGYSAPSVHAFDGTVDTEVFRLPINPDVGATAVPKGILSMIAHGGLIYLSTFDGGTTSADYLGRVFQFNPASGALTLMGATFPTGHLPYALEFHEGKLWVGTNTADMTLNGKIYFIRPNVDTAWTLDITGTNGNYCSLKSFNGSLFAGTMQATSTFAVINQRDALGAWTTSLTTSGGTATNCNGVVAMVVFNSALYAAYFNNAGTAIGKIYKYDGTSWTTPYSGSGVTAICTSGMFVDNRTTIYVMGTSSATVRLLTSTDGTTWTDKTTAWESAGTTTSHGLAVLYGAPT